MKKINKKLIFLKSSVIALGIVFFVLLISLIILQINKGKSNSLDSNRCNNQVIEIENEIEKFKVVRKEVFVLTKINKKSQTQELIKLDGKCQNIITRTKFKIKNVN